MKKLFIAIITDVEGLQVPNVYYIRATDYFAAEEFARELVVEDNGYDEEELDELINFDIRPYREDEVLVLSDEVLEA